MKGVCAMRPFYFLEGDHMDKIKMYFYSVSSLIFAGIAYVFFTIGKFFNEISEAWDQASDYYEKRI